MKKQFFGGIHPKYNKEMSAKNAEMLIVEPKQVVIPLRQHIGVTCEPLVKVGERVLLGQKIGDGGEMCVPVHASVSGTVVAIEPRLHPNGDTVNAIVIDNDFKDESVAFNTCDTPVEELDADAVLHAIHEAGIVGMGGAVFPSSIKAISGIGNIDTLIANACECEPYITSDDILLRTDATQTLEGIRILSRVLSPKRTILAIEDNKKEAIDKLHSLSKNYPEIEIAVLPTKYPQGSEKQLIEVLTGRQVPPNGLPYSVNCVVFNISTFAAINVAIKRGIPLTRRIVTVTGEAVENPRNLICRIGTPFSDVIEAVGQVSDKTDRVINGGPMMGTAQGDLSVPVVKSTNAILCLLKDKNSKSKQTACLRCGKCLSVCPMHLQPLYMYRFTLAKKVDKLSKLNIVDCMECGSCAYTCPAKLPLVEQFRIGKRLLKEAIEK